MSRPAVDATVGNSGVVDHVEIPTPSRSHSMFRAVLVSLAAALLPAVLSAQAPPAALTALTRQVFVAESSFAATMARRDSVAFARFVAPDAVFFGETTVQRGKAAVVERWSRFFAGPDAPFSWRPEKVEVLDSGGLALSTGPVFDPAGHQIGTFSSIWRHESNGSWRVVFDKGCPVCDCERSP
jgi:ketosteroid isomerase-like protein